MEGKLDKDAQYKIVYADAMYAHSWLEYQICELFSALIECEENVAAKIFFNMDYRRYRVISELIEEKYPQYLPAWKKIRNWVVEDSNSITKRRNNIAHWRLIQTVDGHSLANPQRGAVELLMMARGQVSTDENIVVADIEKFTNEAFCLAEIINQFYCCIFDKEYEKGFEVFLDVRDIKVPSDFDKKMDAFREALDIKEDLS